VLKVALVGLGWWGKVMLPLLKTSSRLEVVKAIDADPAAADFARQHGVAFDSRFEAALDDANVQGVILCTPHTTHADQIVRAANAKKHVFCEKPLCMNRADVLRATAAVNANRVALAVGHERRFEPPVIEAFRVAKSGEIGTLLQIEANFSQDKFIGMAPDNWRMSQKEAPAGPMTATGIHLLDLSVGLLGPAERVLATLGALVMFRNGANAMISAILATPFDGRFAVYGSRGWVEVRDKAHPEKPEGWTFTKHLRGGHRETVEYPVAQPVLANLEAFADAATGRAPYPVPQEQMIANVSALEAVFKSAASGQIVKVEG
jgi:predicted dehydrogenase